MILSALLLSLLLLYFLKTWYRRFQKLPPGPRQYPIIGNLGLILPTKEDSSGAIRLWEAAKRFGKDGIVGLRFGNFPAICLSNYDDIKAAYVKEEFCQRKEVFFSTNLARGLAIHTPDDHVHFNIHKPFFVKYLSKCSRADKIEEAVHNATEKLLKAIDELETNVFDPCNLVSLTACCIIYQITFGRSCDFKDPCLQMLVKNINITMSNLSYPISWGMIPSTLFLPGDFFRFKKVQSANDQVNDALRQELRACKDMWAPGRKECFADVFIAEMMNEKSEDRDFTENRAVKMMNVTVTPSTDLLSSAIRWGILRMATHTEIQAKVRDEVMSALNHDTMVSVHDKKHLPYTLATVHEVIRANVPQRMSTVQCTGNYVTTFKDYTLPPQTLIMANWHAVHHDPSHWKDPDVFRPERFLDQDGNFHRDDHFVPFGIGRRKCAGLLLSIPELFVVLATLVRHYDITLPPRCPTPAFTTVQGSVSHEPDPFLVRFTKI